MSLFGCTSNPSRRCDDCVDEEKNRIIHVAFVRKGVSIDTSTPALFASTLLAAELACSAFIIRNTNGAKSAPTAQEGKGRGKQTTRVMAKQHQIDFTDFNYIKNVSFWNSFEDSAINYNMYYFTDTLGWIVEGSQISAMAADPITDDNSTFIEALVTIKWTQKGNPLPYEADVDELEECQELFASVGSWVNRSGGDSVISGTTITQDVNNAVNVAVDTNADLYAVSIDEGTLPTGLSVSVDGQGIVISGTPTVVGTSTVTIRATNECGIAGVTTVTIEIA